MGTVAYDGRNVIGTNANEAVENPVSAARGKVDEAISRVSNAARRLESIADTIFGSVPVGPVGPSTGEKRITRTGEFGLLHDQLDDLYAALRALEDQVIRLDTLAIGAPPRLSR